MTKTRTHTFAPQTPPPTSLWDAALLILSLPPHFSSKPAVRSCSACSTAQCHPPADISVKSCKLPKAFGVGPLSLGIKIPKPLDFRLAFLVNALVLDGIISELELDGTFFGHLEATPVEVSERALEKMPKS